MLQHALTHCRRQLRSRRLLHPITALSVFAAACGDSTGPEVPVVPVPARVQVSPDDIFMAALGESWDLAAQVFDRNGRVITGQDVTWSVSDPAVLELQASGSSARVAAAGTGEATVTAQAGAALGHAAVRVVQLPASLEKTEGDGQRARERWTLPVLPTVHVFDANRHLIDGATVAFRVAEGGGGTAPESAVSVMGRASTTWTLGAAGPQVLVAQAGDASVQFTATAVALGDSTYLAITTTHLSPAYESFAHADTLEAVGGRPPYTWGLATGELPAGLTLTTDGVIRGAAQSGGGSSFVVSAVDAAGNRAAATFELQLCGPSLELEVGEVRIATPAAPGECGFSLRADSAGTYYRVTLVGRSGGFQYVQPVHFEVRGELPVDAVASRNPALEPPVRPSTAAREAPEDHHLRLRREEARLLAGLAQEGRLRALSDLRDTGAVVSAAPPPDTLVVRLGSPGTITDNCTVATRTTTVLQGFNDHLAIYAEPIPDPPLDRANVDILLRHYERYGAEVIDSWGGVADVDGNGRIIVYLDAHMPGNITGLVWVGDMLPTSVCAASNAGEFMRLERDWVESIARILAGTLVHEAQHISSVYKRLLNTLEDPFSYEAQHDVWIEEGRAVMADEAASRLAWADLGGPASHEQVTAAHLAHLSDDLVGVSGIFNALSRTKFVLREDVNAMHFPDPYGSGWHFHRFLGDWYGGAGRERLGDGEFMSRLVATETPPGIAGIERVTDQSFADLMLEYATAISLAGTGAPRLPGVAHFSTYDFTGLEGPRQGMCCWDEPGRYPWPVTTTGQGTSARLWVPLGLSRTMEGEIAATGIRVYDLRASARDEGAVLEIGAPDHVGIIVTRIPDLSQPGR